MVQDRSRRSLPGEALAMLANEKERNIMRRTYWMAGSLVSVLCANVVAQTTIAPKPPFTAAQAEHGKEIAAKSLEIRAQIKNMRDPAEPMKIMGNLYFVGVANGEVYLLTSP